METLKELRNLDKDDILAALGLQSKRNAMQMVLPIAGIFGAGVLVGVGVGMLVAPRSGRELRDTLGQQLNTARERAMSAVGTASEEASAH